MKNVIGILSFCMCVSCASIPLTKAQQVEVGVYTGCAVMGLDTFKCFEDNFVQGIFPGIRESNCAEKILDVINGGNVSVDPSSLIKAKSEKSVCLEVLKDIKSLDIF